MSERELMKGNEAIAEAAIRGGCRFFFGYPITPQNEIPEYMSARLPEVGGVFIQAESEVSAINMVYGAAGVGARAMTSSSSPGISLKQEGISYIAGAELPCVIVNMVRCGPGLGGIQPSQGDYFQSVKGGGHGDYRMLVYGPSTVQEAVELAYSAFDKAEQYRLPVMILGDGMLGQIMEPVSLPEMKDISKLPRKEWAADGSHIGADRKIINSLYIEPDILEAMNIKLNNVYIDMSKNEVMCEEYLCDDAEIIITAYGTVGRIAKSSVQMLRKEGIKAGLIRPITLYPFPTQVYAKHVARAELKNILCVELSIAGQMIEDVRLSVDGKKPVSYFGRGGGNVMSAEDIVKVIKEGR
ncbi:MAG: 3-methyl-2-oxobutanoate dehydrogenase subunit VorB [Clostridia bacterium]|nr:3-methyl-2-oxobutanoate dehydrogenase subunit VorB [Clostridia bacterium]